MHEQHCKNWSHAFSQKEILVHQKCSISFKRKLFHAVYWKELCCPTKNYLKDSTEICPQKSEKYSKNSTISLSKKKLPIIIRKNYINDSAKIFHSVGLKVITKPDIPKWLSTKRVKGISNCLQLLCPLSVIIWKTAWKIALLIHTSGHNKCS